MFMDQQKNLHASVPPALLVEVEKVAAERHVTMDELVQQAMGRIIGEFRQEKHATQGEPFWKSFTKEVHALPEAVFEKLPQDGASEHDHYLYGSPKRNA
jgi:hypothetical protein